MNTMTTANCFRSLIVSTLFGVLSSSFAALPAAADSFEPPTVTVKYSDLDISHPRDAIVLYRRIHTAAANVCAPYDRGGSLSAKMHLKACVNKTVEDAVVKINEPALIAVYSARTGKTLPARVASVPSR